MKSFKTTLLFIGWIIFGSIACSSPRAGYTPQQGDVIFQSFPHSELADAIESVSQSAYSHCGLVVQNGSNFAVLEAIGPVTETDLDSWIRRGRENAFAVYRWTPKHQPEIGRIITAAKSYLGRPYDIHFSFDDEAIYCSELIFKAYKQVTGENLGTVRRIRDLNWKPNEAFIRKIEEGELPLDREMITPKDLSESPSLQKYFQQGF